MLGLRGSLIVLLVGSTSACVGPLGALEPLRPLAPEPVCTSDTKEVPAATPGGEVSSQAYSECSVSLRRR